MADQNQKKTQAPDWNDLREAPPLPKGPAKPWPEDMKAAAEEFVGFLKDPAQKQVLQNYIMDAFKRFETEKMDEFQARIENEREVDARRIAPHHQPGNIGPMISEDLNMSDAERNFARGLRTTKAALQRAVEDRVEQINHLLAGLGGFSSQLKSCFARSTVVFLEEEDPRYSYRERLIFSVNLPSFELKRSWKNDAEVEGPSTVKRTSGKKRGVSAEDSDPRSPLQATWDDAVNTLAQIIAETGLKPKYAKNDRHYGRFVMKQDLRSSSNLPDEYFSFTLDYNTTERIQDMIAPFNKKVTEYEKKIRRLEARLKGTAIDSRSPRLMKLRAELLKLTQERDFFVGTTPDPNQLSEGLLFLIEVSTSKDYHIVKDRMQAIMTKYILHLSKLAVLEAKGDPDLEHALYSLDSREQSRAAANQVQEDRIELTESEIDALPQYTVSAGTLKSVKKKAA